MKTLFKLLTALAALAGAIYAIATYGEQIVAWARSVMAKLPKCPCCQECTEPEATEETPAEEAAPVEETPAEAEAPVEEAPVEEAPAEEAPVVAAPTEPVAEDNDFAE